VTLEAAGASSGSIGSKYVVARAPIAYGKALVEMILAQPQVDWVEQTPHLTVWNKYARGVTQSGDWEVSTH